MVSMQGLGPTLGVEAVSMEGLEMCPNDNFEPVERHYNWVWMAIFALLLFGVSLHGDFGAFGRN